jgi:hypothetical protein
MSITANTSAFAKAFVPVEPHALEHGDIAQMTSARRLPWFTQMFSGINLAQLNQRAELLTRMDNKYVLTLAELTRALPLFTEHFDVLDIDGLRSFGYDSCYFDDISLANYHDHQRGKRQRLKIRVRHYLESDQCFLEVKLKDKRDITVKQRWAHAPTQIEQLDTAALARISQAHLAHYRRAYELPLFVQLRNRYQRITLASKRGAERMTIDHNLSFSVDGHSVVLPDVFVLEAKSHNANGLADRMLRSLHQHPATACSKYCVGLAITGRVQRYNRFLPALRRLGLYPERICLPRANHVPCVNSSHNPSSY